MTDQLQINLCLNSATILDDISLYLGNCTI